MSAKDKLIKRAANIKKDTVTDSGSPKKVNIDQRYTAGGISSINIHLIVENEKNIRQIKDSELTSLINSIKETGLQQNLVVSKIGANQYKLLSGHRRFRALKILHEQYPKDHRFELIPCLVVNIEPDAEHDISEDLTERMLIATTNIEIESLSKKELLDAVLICEEYYSKKHAGEKKKKTIVKEDIGKSTGLSQKYIYDILKFNAELIPEFKSLYFEKEMLRHRIARILVNLDEAAQYRVFEQFKNEISGASENDIKQFLEDSETKSSSPVDESRPEDHLNQNGGHNHAPLENKQKKEKSEVLTKESSTYQYENLPEIFQKKIKTESGKREFILPNELPKMTELSIDVLRDIEQLQPKSLKTAKRILNKTEYRKYVSALNQISKQFCIIADLFEE